MTIDVYSKKNCNGCIATDRKMAKHNLEYNIHKMDEDSTLYEKAASYGYNQAPIVVVTHADGTEESWSGYRPDSIERIANM